MNQAHSSMQASRAGRRGVQAGPPLGGDGPAVRRAPLGADPVGGGRYQFHLVRTEADESSLRE